MFFSRGLVYVFLFVLVLRDHGCSTEEFSRAPPSITCSARRLYHDYTISIGPRTMDNVLETESLPILFPLCDQFFYLVPRKYHWHIIWDDDDGAASLLPRCYNYTRPDSINYWLFQRIKRRTKLYTMYVFTRNSYILSLPHEARMGFTLASIFDFCERNSNELSQTHAVTYSTCILYICVRFIMYI